MVKLRVTGEIESVEIFNKLVSDWVSQNGVINSSANRKYKYSKGIIRRYFHLEFSSMRGELSKIEEEIELSAKISGSMQEVSVMLNRLKGIAAVFYISSEEGDFFVEPSLKQDANLPLDLYMWLKASGDYGVKVSFRDRKSVVREKLLSGIMNPDLKFLK